MRIRLPLLVAIFFTSLVEANIVRAEGASDRVSTATIELSDNGDVVLFQGGKQLARGQRLLPKSARIETSEVHSLNGTWVAVMRTDSYAYVVAGDDGQLKRAWSNPIGESRNDWTLTLEFRDGFLLKYWSHPEITRCDGTPALVAVEGFDPVRGEFRAIRQTSGLAPNAEILPTEALDNVRRGGEIFEPVALSSDRLRPPPQAPLPPSILADGDVNTAWQRSLESTGRGEFATFRAPFAAPVAAIEIAVNTFGDRLSNAEKVAAPKRPSPATLALFVGDKQFTVSVTDSLFRIELPAPVASKCVAVALAEIDRALSLSEINIVTTSDLHPDGPLVGLLELAKSQPAALAALENFPDEQLQGRDDLLLASYRANSKYPHHARLAHALARVAPSAAVLRSLLGEQATRDHANAIARTIVDGLDDNLNADAREYLLELTAHKDPGVRIAAIDALIPKSSEPAPKKNELSAATLSALAEASNDAWPQVRYAAIIATSQNCDARGFPMLKSAASRDQSVRVASAAISEITRCFPRDSFDITWAIVTNSDRDAKIRAHAARRLQLGTPSETKRQQRVLAYFSELRGKAFANPELAEVAASIATALGEIAGNSAARSALREAALDGAFPRLQQAALNALLHHCTRNDREIFEFHAGAQAPGLQRIARLGLSKCQ